MSYGPQTAYQPQGTFACPRCGTPVRHGAPFCPNCNTPFQAAGAPQAIPGQAYYAQPYTGQAAYDPRGAYAQAHRAQKRKKAEGYLAGGAVLLLIGLVITFASGGYVFAYGAIVFGFIYLVRGLVGMGAN